MTAFTTLRKRDLAERLQISVRTFDRRRADGEILKPLEGSGHPRWSALEVDAWIAAGSPRAAVWSKHNLRRR
jgi:predicted DNA-binding transcriptional regulator AlpA